MLSNQCTSIIKDYQHQVNTQAEKNEKTNRFITMLLYTTLFLNNLSYKVTVKYKVCRGSNTIWKRLIRSAKLSRNALPSS